MHIGFVTPYSEERVKFAKETGFDCLEIFVDEGMLEEKRIKEVKRVFDRYNVKIGTIACSVNHLDPDPKKREKNNETFVKALRVCRQFGTDIVATNAWGDRTKSVKENILVYKEVFTEYARVAEAEDVKIAIENCPHMGRYPFTIGNIAFSPEVWELLFEAVPSKNIGLEYDPSHLFWLGIDYIKGVYDFGDRIYAVHTKDTEILKDTLSKRGIYGENWWRYRIPGWGDINWQKFIASLYDVGYKGDLIIEHEDPVFGGELTDEGLKLGLRYLRQFTI